MTEAAAFLSALGHALASMRFYPEGHAARGRAVEDAYRAARALLDRDHLPRFSFAAGTVSYHRTPLGELEDWEWARRLERADIAVLELQDHLSSANFTRFLSDLAARLAGRPLPSAKARTVDGVRLAPRDDTANDSDTEPDLFITETPLEIGAEIDAIDWIHEHAASKRKVPFLEADAVVRSLDLTINQANGLTLPLVRTTSFDQYATTHACNVAVLAIAFARYTGSGEVPARALGLCGLLHDIGNVRIPRTILTRPGRLDRSERELIDQHPVHGARILIEREPELELAAVVAWEHHQWFDGAGYPRRTRNIPTHPASRMVQICDAFDALCSDRPYRTGLPPGIALAGIEAEAGSHFDPDLVPRFTAMIRELTVRVSSPIAEPSQA